MPPMIGLTSKTAGRKGCLRRRLCCFVPCHYVVVGDNIAYSLNSPAFYLWCVIVVFAALRSGIPCCAKNEFLRWSSCAIVRYHYHAQ